MKAEKRYNLFFVVTACCLILVACSKMDEYKDFSNGKEILYTGKPDSIIASPGKNRVKLSWLRSSDPKVAKTRIYWNSRADSIEVQINNTVPGSGRLSTIISNLPEGSYNFELLNFDNQGNSSVVSMSAGVVYGEVYEKSLLNRGISGFGKQFDLEANTVLNWFGSDAKSIGVELTYKDLSGADKKLIVAPATTSNILSDYNSSFPLVYRTMFLPDSTAIDTFYTAAASRSVSNQILIKNPGNPFMASKWAGRWGDIADWITTDPVKNHGGVGGLDNLNRTDVALMSLEYWGTPAIVNGKVYQTGTLAPGSYRLVVNTENINNNLENSYLSVAKGNILPDVANVNESLVNLKFISGMSNKDLTLPFTLTQTEIVSLGVVSIMQQVNESSLRIRSFKLFKD